MTRSVTLRVDPTACRAHGLCAEMLPDLVRLDEWGYPIIGPEPVAAERERDLRAAARACPTPALRLRRIDSSC